MTVIEMIAAKVVVFDLDGTLIKSRIDYEEMRRRAVSVLAAFGAPVGELEQSGRVWAIIMGGERMLEELGMPLETRRMVLKRITEELNEVELGTVELVEPTPHAREALKELKERGLGIGVATRSCNAYAIRSLKLTDLAQYVDVLLARDDVEHPKPDARHLLQVIEAMGASPSDAFFVGDTTTDLRTAEEAGVSFIGFHREDDWGRRLREAGCEFIIDDLRMVAAIVERRLNN